MATRTPHASRMGKAITQARAMSSASLDAGSFRGTIQGYEPLRTTGRDMVAAERNLSLHRAEDLYANDWAAKSAVNSIATNVIGTGLVPQSCIPHQRLGIDREAAKEVQEQMEWLWAEWCAQAHYREQMHFEDLQNLAVRSLVRAGEFVHLPVMEERPGCRFALRIQDVRPSRLRTPFDKLFDPFMHDGVEVNATGVPTGYWLASPQPSAMYLDDSVFTSASFVRIPAKVGHRPGIFHVFRAEQEEQFRGVSCLSTGVKSFRHLNDAIDYELVAQVMAASFPVFIALEDKNGSLPSYVEEETGDNGEKRYYQEVPTGGVMYGNKGEKPEVLESKRPSQNFLNFCELILRSVAASIEIPYEVLTKDFSKTTYSSARAALLEAWRVYQMYRNFFVRHYCQPNWCMVQEEAYLRGYLRLPPNAPDFYTARLLWCNTKWIGPARGYIDPTKEISANISAINARLMSRAEAIAERGGDYDEVVEQIAAEEARLDELGLSPMVTPPAQNQAVQPAPSAHLAVGENK